MRYTVTGGAGFIGSNLADALARHHDVIIANNLAAGRRVNIEHLLDHPRMTFVEGSITDLDLLMETFPGVDGSFHQWRSRLCPGRESLYTLVRRSNNFMPEHMLRLMDSVLGEAGKTLTGAMITLLG